MFCQSCAKELQPDANVCSACGAAVARGTNVASGANAIEAETPSRGVLSTISRAKRFSPALFGFALVCFLLPFVTVSCNQRTVASFTGFQLVFGTTLQQPQMFGPAKVQRVEGEPLAMLAFACCAVALGLSLVKKRGGEIGATVLCGINLLALLVLKSRLEDEVRQQSSGFLQVNYEFGFWLLICSTVVAGALNATTLWRSKSR